jgi:hypothetical protein
MVDRPNHIHSYSMKTHDLDRTVRQTLSIGYFGRSLERAVDEKGAELAEVPTACADPLIDLSD